MASATTQEFCVYEELTGCNYCRACGLEVWRHGGGWEGGGEQQVVGNWNFLVSSLGRGGFSS